VGLLAPITWESIWGSLCYTKGLADKPEAIS